MPNLPNLPGRRPTGAVVSRRSALRRAFHGGLSGLCRAIGERLARLQRAAGVRVEFSRLPRAAGMLALFSACAVSGFAQAAQTCAARSPEHRLALVELYSSEGCNDCPPADDWLGQWKDGAQQDIVPLALHVDYWDGLGWTDRFAQHRFTERQQTLASIAGGHVVYTPEVFVGGHEMRRWSDPSSFEARVRQVAAQSSPVDITIGLVPQGAGDLAIDALFASRETAPRDWQAYVAVYENGLVSQVKAGENRGATLHHERVVRQWIGPVPVIDGHARIAQTVKLDSDTVADAITRAGGTGTGSASRYGVVAFVEQATSGDVVQAADLPLCR
jgi:hypothetical protein